MSKFDVFPWVSAVDFFNKAAKIYLPKCCFENTIESWSLNLLENQMSA